MQNQGQSLQRPPVDLDQTMPVQCDQCYGTLFQQSIIIRKVPGLLVGRTENTYLPIPVFSCVECNHVNEEFLPVEIKDEQTNKDS